MFVKNFRDRTWSWYTKVINININTLPIRMKASDIVYTKITVISHAEVSLINYNYLYWFFGCTADVMPGITFICCQNL